MNATFEDRVNEVLARVNVKKPETITEAARVLLADSVTDLKAGTKVAVIDDPTYPAAGQTGKVRGKAAQEGFVDVELANGAVMAMQADLLIPV